VVYPLQGAEPEVPIAPTTSTPAPVTTSSLFQSSSPVQESLPYLARVNSYPYPYFHFNLGYLSPQSPVCLQDSDKEKETTDLEVQSWEIQNLMMDSGWSMVFEQVTEIKKQRHELEQKKREVEQHRIQVDWARYDLEIREIKLLEFEPLILIARQL